LLAGPILNPREMLPQFSRNGWRLTANNLAVGSGFFLIGLLKKTLLADPLSAIVSAGFAYPVHLTLFPAWQAAASYSLMLYFDFSGYTDMAIGCGRILGFRFPDNFKMPYSAGNITEFWRRWHITLSQWFRDYLFLPLEIATRNNPSPMLRVSLNMMVTMLLCGLWHGPSWTFVIWGGIHGAALAVHKIWTTWNPLASLKERRWFQIAWTGLSHGLTLGIVALSMVFFRAPSLSVATAYLNRLVLWSHSGTRLLSPYILSAVVGVFLVHLLVNKDRNLAEELPQRSLAPRILGYASLLLLLVVFGATDSEAFIYFQF